MTPTPVVANGPEKIKVAKNLFDLDSFERKTIEKEITLQVVPSFDKILDAVGNDESVAVKVFNKGYRREQINDAKRSIAADNLVSPKAVSGFVNQFKAMFPIDRSQLDSKGDPTPEGRKSQLQSIYALIRATPALLQAIRAQAAALAAMEDDEDDSPAVDSPEVTE